ncbi:MAG: 50S ribosomal protein L15 [Gammaproteobacteria bacterium]|nr:50S ribosomal protein L15 [Gammaproteobacteria bacterium]MXX95708.1 50S ribosomal protein L15 [Gammaproteobacteria bacterium]MYF53325.1 50S ribosomal protein L15 [Gammaproteobacteria bacterium]MYK44453.1 50S ribosomal protein L15 [Gammaproteobacteria bacterium]
MKLNELQAHPKSRQTRKRVGRGGSAGQGKTCGRGHKGQLSRSGGKVAVGFEGGQLPLQQRIPTFGFRSRISRVTDEIRLHELNRVEGEDITLETLRTAGLIRSSIRRCKIIQSGTLERAVHVRGIKVTKGAREIILSIGGTVEE